MKNLVVRHISCIPKWNTKRMKNVLRTDPNSLSCNTSAPMKYYWLHARVFIEVCIITKHNDILLLGRIVIFSCSGYICFYRNILFACRYNIASFSDSPDIPYPKHIFLYSIWYATHTIKNVSSLCNTLKYIFTFQLTHWTKQNWWILSWSENWPISLQLFYFGKTWSSISKAKILAWLWNYNFFEKNSGAIIIK